MVFSDVALFLLGAAAGGVLVFLVLRVFAGGASGEEGGGSFGAFTDVADVTGHKELQDAYQTLVENSLQGLLLIQEDGPVFANFTVGRISGYTAEEFTAMSTEELLALIHREDREEARERMLGRLAGESHPQLTTLRLIRKDGSIRWIETLASRIQYRGRPTVQVAYRDVTEEKVTEEQLRQEKRFTEMLLTSLPGVFYLLDAEGNFVRWNRNLEEVLGYTSEELENVYPLDLVAEEEREKAERHLRRVFTEGQTATELTIVAGDGRRLAYFVTGKRVELGGAVHLIGMGVDIGERRQRERELESFVTVAQALRAANSRREILPIVLEETMNLLRARGAMFVVHRAGEEKVIELARGDWVSLSGRRVPAGAEFQGFDAAAGRLYMRDDGGDVLVWPGADRPVEVQAIAGAPLMSGEEVLGVIWAGRGRPFTAAEGRSLMAVADIAAGALDRARLLKTMEQQVAERTQELATANERLRQVDRVKSKLMDDLSHELRTPVTTINLYVNLLKQGAGEKREQYLRVLRAQSERLNQVIESVLQFTRLEAMAAGRMPTAIDVNEVVEKAVAGLRQEAADGELDLRYRPGDDLPAVRGIPQLLGHAVTQLLDNAIRYTPEGAVTVRTHVDEAGERVCVEVEDTGIGIGDEDLPYVFERFYRGRRVSQLTTPGAGLGLSLAQQIAVRHGGEIEVESVVEEGTAVRLWLPVADVS